MNHFVYILYSPTKDTYYIGETSDLENRLHWHNSGEFKSAYSKITNDWTVFFSFECQDIIQARKIEKHIKSMKSKIYLQNLSKHPEMSKKLIDRHP
ncbi:GIY-YIG nuclease family protein [Flavobacterium laiguense]|uniref:Endonuclease n=1 Tax=Flavobacterium laiguense TaxID=2169409 RepID=A0A2U1K364_9FLAO|nr:GIY-YIG nuclease family protein [Flavobacterium laiguense]PWA11413.1 endonuclease [Flavobacterium laiguense]